MNSFSERLRAAMGPHMTAAELARDLSEVDGIALSRVAVSKWLSGATENVRMAHLVALADLLRVELRWLMAGAGDRKQKAGTRPTLSADENACLDSFRKLSPAVRHALKAYMVMLAKGDGGRRKPARPDELAPRRLKKA